MTYWHCGLVSPGRTSSCHPVDEWHEWLKILETRSQSVLNMLWRKKKVTQRVTTPILLWMPAWPSMQTNARKDARIWTCDRHSKIIQNGQVYNAGADTLPAMKNDGPMESIRMYWHWVSSTYHMCLRGGLRMFSSGVGLLQKSLLTRIILMGVNGLARQKAA